jgi:hypothetical protein
VVTVHSDRPNGGVAGVTVVDDGEELATSLSAWLDTVSFADQDADKVTELLVDAVVSWGRSQRWRVYRRAPSVLTLPPPYANRHSVVDVGCARAGAAPIVIEIDRSDRRRTIDKLLAEARAGRIALWVRWGSGPFVAPPLPVRLVSCLVAARRDPVSGRRLYSSRAGERPAPAHSAVDVDATSQADLFGSEPSA